MADAKLNPSVAPASPPPDDGLTRIRIKTEFVSRGSGYVFTACVVSMFVAQVLTRSMANRLVAVVVIIAVTLLGFVAAYWIHASIRRRKINALALRQDETPLPALAQTLFDGMKRVDVGHRARALVRHLQFRHIVNETYGICWHDEIKAVRSAKTPFEPCLIENTESFVDSNFDETNGMDFGAPPFVFEGRAKFLVSALGTLSIGIAGIWLIAWLAQSRYWLTGLVYPMNLLLIVGFAYWGVWRFLHRDQWLLVPGGVVFRKGRILSSSVQLMLYDRRTSVACVVEMDFQRWMLTLAQDRSITQRVVPDYQLERFLQAWLSPLPPPVERWVDLESS